MSSHVESGPDENAYRVSLEDATDRAAVGVLVEAVAEIDGVEPTDLTSLSTRLDPEALDALLTSAADAPRGESLSVEFTCWGYRITVRPGEAVITPEGDAGRSESPADR